MKNDSSIFLRRPGQAKIIGGIRYVSTFVSSNKIPMGIQKNFRLSRSNFKPQSSQNQNNFLFSPQKKERTTEYTASLSPTNKNVQRSKYKLCNSKNVCVFSNLKRVEKDEESSQNPSPKDIYKKDKSNSSNINPNLLFTKNLSPRFKRLKNMESLQSTPQSFNLRKISSSRSYREPIKNKEKMFDAWNTEDLSEDPDILFYK